MSAEVYDMLAYDMLTEMYSANKDERPFLLTDNFYTNPEDVEGVVYRLLTETRETEPAPLNHRGSEARLLSGDGLGEKIQTLFSSFNQMRMSAEVMDALKEPNSPTLQDKGRTEMVRQIVRTKKRHQFQKEVVLAKILGDGVVYMNDAGVVLESSSGATVTADFGVSANHKNQLNGLIAATWATAGTDIHSQLENIRAQAEQEDVDPPTEIWCNPLLKNYLRNNTDFQTWATYNQESSKTILGGSMIEGLWGFNWHFYGRTYTNSAGAKSYFIPTDRVILTPPKGDWLRATRGSTLVPSDLNLKTSMEEALNSLQKIYGEFAYASIEHNPVQLSLFMGDVFGLHYADPNAIWQADVVF